MLLRQEGEPFVKNLGSHTCSVIDEAVTEKSTKIMKELSRFNSLIC